MHSTSSNDITTYIHLSRYARYLPDKGRRENWGETVDRYVNFFKNRAAEKAGDLIDWDELRSAIYNLEVMPSMRALMTAGEALDRDNVAGYNCAYVATDHVVAFDEAMYVLMCGTGVGFSVERDAIRKLPPVQKDTERTVATYKALQDIDPELAEGIQCNSRLRELCYIEAFPDCDISEISYLGENDVIKVQDSKIGWASALRVLITELYNCNFDVTWDLSLIRPAGDRLKVFGGRASGPAPLDELFHFTKQLFMDAEGRKLHTIECHDLMCKIAQVVVVGGVRRSAMISLSNLSDMYMQKAKTGTWYEDEKQRALANNSVAYTEKPDMGTFMQESLNLYESRSGERGIFNRQAAQKLAARFGRRSESLEYGTNPCSEIILRSCQFCNLSEGVIRPSDTFDVFRRKARVASILGTLQSTLTNFRYLRPKWKDNTSEERLLGVSLTGVMDHPYFNTLNPTMETQEKFFGAPRKIVPLPFVLEDVRQEVNNYNAKLAEALGIPATAAATCIKPSGTVSQLCGTASGMHARHSEYYLRTYRADKKDPLAEFMQEQGIPCEEDVTNHYNLVFSFPIKSPETTVTRKDRTAIEMLELWKCYQLHWCDHKPSVTINVREHEWLDVFAWVYENFDIVSGISFMPYSDHIYKQAPEQELTYEEYVEWCSRMPDNIPWDEFVEDTDNTTGSQELACTGGACELT